MGKETFVNGRKEKPKRKHRRREQEELKKKTRKIRERRERQRNRTNKQRPAKQPQEKQELDKSPLDEVNKGRGSGTEESSVQEVEEKTEQTEIEEQSENEIEITQEKKRPIRQFARKRVDNLKKRARKWRIVKMGAGALALLSLITIPVLIGLFALFFIAMPIMVVVLPGAAFSILTEGESGDISVTDTAISAEETGGEYGKQVTDVEMIDGSVWPVPHTKNVTSTYGPRSCSGCSRFHRGLDLSGGGDTGKPVVAYMDGVVERSNSQGTTHVSSSGNMGSGYGWVVVIDHQNGYKTLYAHLYEKGIDVGTEVKAGDQIGKVGSTGASSGAHLHFEIHKEENGGYSAIDPRPYVSKYGLTGK